jgi:hypothetical protein
MNSSLVKKMRGKPSPFSEGVPEFPTWYKHEVTPGGWSPGFGPFLQFGSTIIMHFFPKKFKFFLNMWFSTSFKKLRQSILY